jgi:3-hydroxyisobutyrate dehydrogenase-like beta-hydroxyacid dehydrogenase
MSAKPRIGFIGVGLMGHGVVKNLLEKGGFGLTILGHRNREPVDDLVKRGAAEAAHPQAVAEASDVVILCLPSSAEVEAIVYGANGLLDAMRPGMILIDTTTADPIVTRKIGADLAARGVDMIDAALGRTPKEAEAGTLATYVGSDEDLLGRVRPILECYTDTIVHCGGLGAGTTSKLIANSVSIGIVALFAEAIATGAKVGVDINALCDVMGAGGADGRTWRRIEPWIRSGDDSHLRGPIRIAAKDVRTYGRVAEDAGSAIPIAQAINQTLRLVLNHGHGNEFLPVLPGIVAELNGTPIKRVRQAGTISV